MIISDIEVNKEITNPNVFFFEKQNPAHLAKKMFDIIEKRPVRPHQQILKEKSIDAHNRLGDALLNAIKFAIKESNNS